jgi:carbonic anhydrase/acetyltransferase-like protein (isoleucine patch superfamily)
MPAKVVRELDDEGARSGRRGAASYAARAQRYAAQERASRSSE